MGPNVTAHNYGHLMKCLRKSELWALADEVAKRTSGKGESIHSILCTHSVQCIESTTSIRAAISMQIFCACCTKMPLHACICSSYVLLMCIIMCVCVCVCVCV